MVELSEGVVMLVVGFVLIQGLWLSVLTYLLYRRAQERGKARPLPEPEGDTVIEEVFLLHRSGLLIRHLTRRLKPHVDSDILTGMLRAVQEFVRDSFRGEMGELNQMTFGELKISIATGRHVVIATVIRGERPVDIMAQMKAALRHLEEDHHDLLEDWDGTVEAVQFVDDYLNSLLKGKYKDEAEGSHREEILLLDHQVKP